MRRVLELKEQNPPLIEELYDLWKSINRSNAREYLHDSLDHMESLLTLFDLGYIDLEDGSNTEILVNLIIKKSIYLLKMRVLMSFRGFKIESREKYFG